MSTLRAKALRELGRERARAALVVLAIAAGIAGFTAVLSSWAVLARELDRGYLATNPAALVLRVDRVDDALLAAARAHPAVREVEARRSLPGRARAGPTHWKDLRLFAVPDFAAVRVSRLEPEAGAWPPARGEVLIERDALQVANAEIGGELTVRTRPGRDLALRVAGSVHDAGQAQARMENVVYGYVTTETLEDLGEEPWLDRLLVTLSEGAPADPAGAEARARAVGEELAALARGLGREVRDLDVPPAGRHPHADIMGLLLLLEVAFGLFVLALAGVLVLVLSTARMAAHVRQVGVLKTLGGTRGRVARHYLGQALALGAAALVLGLPAGLAGGLALSRRMAVLLNFDLASVAVPAWVLALAAGVGLVVPTFAAALPVWRGCAVNVRAALGEHGVAARAFGTGRVERALARVRGPSRALSLALRNALRRRARLALTLSALAVGGVFFLTALGVRASLIRTLDRLFETRRSDLSVTLAELSPRDALERALASTSGVVRWEGWISTEAELADADAPPAAEPARHSLHGLGAHGGAGGERPGFPVLALPPESELVARDIAAGRDLLPGERDALVVNSALAQELDLEPGDTPTLAIGPSELPWRVVGVAREPFAPPLAYAPRALFDDAHAGASNALRLVLASTEPAAVDAVREALDRELEREGLRALGSRTERESRYGFDQHMEMLYVLLLVVAGVLALVGGVGLATAMALAVAERRGELAVLRALGATPAALARMVALEGVAVALAAWALAGLVAWPLGALLGDVLLRRTLRTELDAAFALDGLAAWLAVSLVLGALASLAPALHASRVPVREALARE